MISYELFGNIPKTSMDRSNSICMVGGYLVVRGVWVYLDIGEISYGVTFSRGLIQVDPRWCRTRMQEKEC